MKYSCYQDCSVIRGWFVYCAFLLTNAPLFKVIGNPISDGIDFVNEQLLTCHCLKGLCHPTRTREPMKTNLKKSARLFQVLSEILEGCFYLYKSQPSFDS